MSQSLKNQYSISIAKKAAGGDAAALAQLGNSKAFALGFASWRTWLRLEWPRWPASRETDQEDIKKGFM